MRDKVQCLVHLSNVRTAIKRLSRYIVHHVPRDEPVTQTFNNGLHCIWDDGLIQLSHGKVQRIVREPVRSLAMPETTKPCR